MDKIIKALGPYQIQRRMIVKDIETAAAAGNTYDIENMVRDLDRVYKDLHGDDEDNEEGDKKEADDHALATFTKQFKAIVANVERWGTRHFSVDQMEMATDKIKA